MGIGEVAEPPFAVLPNADRLFARRSERFSELAGQTALEPYLQFLAQLSGIQHELAAITPEPPPSLPRARPPLCMELTLSADMSDWEPADHCVRSFCERLASADTTTPIRSALASLLAASPRQRRALAGAALLGTPEPEDVAPCVLAVAGLQPLFTRLASVLDLDELRQHHNDRTCPACGGPPAVSSVVGWPRAANTRFCACSLCGTQWHVVRIKCLMCGEHGGIGYLTLEGDTRSSVKAETCDGCGHYVKILYQVDDPGLEPVADDVATAGLDIKLETDGWCRGGRNPFLLGY